MWLKLAQVIIFVLLVISLISCGDDKGKVKSDASVVSDAVVLSDAVVISDAVISKMEAALVVKEASASLKEASVVTPDGASVSDSR